MTAKTWTTSEIRALARQFIKGRKQAGFARGEYLRAVIETAQAELGGRAEKEAQLTAVKAVHKRFQTIVEEAIATDDILLADKIARNRRGKERNRRMNFVRTAYGAIKRWLRVPENDLMKLHGDITKGRLEREGAPARKHTLTPERAKARAGRFTDQLVGYAKMVARAEPSLAVNVLEDAIARLRKTLQAAREKA